MEFVRHWIHDIIYILIFAAVLEVLLPNNSTRRFVKVVVGMLVLLTVLQPVLTLVNQQSDSDSVMAMVSQQINPNAAKENKVSAQYLQNQQHLAVEQYKRQLVQQVKALACAVEGVGDVRVKVDMEEQSVATTGKVKSIVVAVKGGKRLTSDQKQVNIEPIQIGREQMDNQLPKPVTPEILSKVRKTICDMLQLHADQVYVETDTG